MARATASGWPSSSERRRSVRQRQAIAIVGTATWSASQASYRDLFTAVAARHPDCVYLGGVYDNNGARVLADKVAVLGDNTTTKLLGPDGFTGWPDMDSNPNAAGMYMTFDGLSLATIAAKGGAAARFVDAYQARYGAIPTYLVMYGVAAMQVVLAAIAKSDGTRRGVTDAVFHGAGTTVPAMESVLARSGTDNPACERWRTRRTVVAGELAPRR
jgi:branched-chain amino acid transport system substrate-binding protein